MLKRHLVAVTLVLAAPLAPQAALALQATAARYAPAEAGRFQSNGPLTLDLATGRLVSAFELDAGPFAGTPEAQARSYLAQEATLYGLRSDLGDLEMTREQHGPWADYVRFRQTLGGVPVRESDLVVTIRRSDHHVSSVTSRYRPVAFVPVTLPVLSMAQARDAAVAHLQAGVERIGDESVELAFLAREGAPLLVYRVVIPAAQPLGDWEVLVDAATGQVVRTADNARSVDGSGLVFDPDPVTTAGVPYTDPGYGDGNDASTPQLAAQQFTRTLRDLTFSGGMYRLEGPYCRIVEFESPASAPVTSADPNGFVFDRSQQGFEDVNVYWAIDMSQRYIQSLGFTNLQNGPISCDPHGLNGADNSHYIPSSNRLAWGEGGVDDAEDLDVVLHEYGHAIQQASVPGWSGNGESGAMGEGFGDYWAGSYSTSISGYRNNWVFNWDGHNNFWPGRVLDNPAHYPEGIQGEVHADGEIWSANLWLMRNEICREAADRTTLDHHFAQSANSTFHQAAQSWVQSDKNLNQGLNVDTFVSFSRQRGILLPVDYPLPLITHTPLVNQVGDGPYVVTATVTSELTETVTAVELRYGVNGAPDQTIAMTPTANPDEWSAGIPTQTGSVTVNYFVVATNTAGNKATHPRPAPCGGVHSFQVSNATAVAGAPGRPGVQLGPPQPNPSSTSTSLDYSLPAAGPVRLTIFGMRGERVRTLVEETQSAGSHLAQWDGRTDDGRLAPAGVYACRLEAAGTRVVRPLVRLR